MKEGLKKEEVVFLGQLIGSLEEAMKKLEVSYENKNYEDFNQLKEFMLSAQQKISEVLE